MTSARSPEQRARLSRESGLDLNRFDSVTHLVGSLGTRPNARLYEYVILSESLQSSSLPIYQFTNLPIFYVVAYQRCWAYPYGYRMRCIVHGPGGRGYTKARHFVGCTPPGALPEEAEQRRSVSRGGGE